MGVAAQEIIIESSYEKLATPNLCHQGLKALIVAVRVRFWGRELHSLEAPVGRFDASPPAFLSVPIAKLECNI